MHLPAGHPGLPLATTALCGVRTFLDPVPARFNSADARGRDRLGGSFARISLLQGIPEFTFVCSCAVAGDPTYGVDMDRLLHRVERRPPIHSIRIRHAGLSAAQLPITQKRKN